MRWQRFARRPHSIDGVRTARLQLALLLHEITAHTDSVSGSNLKTCPNDGDRIVIGQSAAGRSPVAQTLDQVAAGGTRLRCLGCRVGGRTPSTGGRLRRQSSEVMG